jgi:hypothetical protein
MFFGNAIFPNVYTDSICGISFIVFNIMASAFFRNIIMAVVSAKVLELLI